MIDNYPHDRDYNALCAELREMREQKERLYFRDEALNQPEPKQQKSKKDKSDNYTPCSSDITTYEATRIMVNHGTQTQDSNEFTNGCFFGIVLSVIALITLVIIAS